MAGPTGWVAPFTEADIEAAAEGVVAADTPAAAQAIGETLLARLVVRTLEQARESVKKGAPEGTARADRLAELELMIGLVEEATKPKDGKTPHEILAELSGLDRLRQLSDPKLTKRIAEQAEIIWKAIKTGWNKVFGKEGYIRGPGGTNERIANWCKELAKDFKAFHARNVERYHMKMDAIGDALDRAGASVVAGRVQGTAAMRRFGEAVVQTVRPKVPGREAEYEAERRLNLDRIEKRKAVRLDEISEKLAQKMGRRDYLAAAREEASKDARMTRGEREAAEKAWRGRSDGGSERAGIASREDRRAARKAQVEVKPGIASSLKPAHTPLPAGKTAGKKRER